MFDPDNGEYKWVKIQRSNGPIIHLIRGLDVRTLAPDSITAMQSLGQSDLVLFDGEIIHDAAQQKTSEKNPSNGMRKLVHLNRSTASDRVCFVRLLPTCLIIRSRRHGAMSYLP